MRGFLSLLDDTDDVAIFSSVSYFVGLKYSPKYCNSIFAFQNIFVHKLSLLLFLFRLGGFWVDANKLSAVIVTKLNSVVHVSVSVPSTSSSSIVR